MIKKVGIVANPDKKKAIKIQREIKRFLEERKVKVFTDRETSRNEIAQKVDLIITLGGDGTLLNIAKYINRKVEILGVNVGGFGFLTEVNSKEVYSTLNDVLNKRYSLGIKKMLKADAYRKGKLIRSLVALNDMVINKGSLSRILTLSLAIENENVATYLCDGLIIATSTGSTAHSLSAGGPIVSGDLNVMILTPICPHTLSNRPLVLSMDKEIKVKLSNEDAQDVALTADGQVAVKLEFGDSLTIKKAPINLRLILSNKRSYFKILKEKLKWGKLR